MSRRHRTRWGPGVLIAWLLAVATAPSTAAGAPSQPTSEASACTDLPVAAGSAGWDRTAVERLAAEAIERGADAFMLVTRGEVVVAAGAVDEPMAAASIRKPILGALVGLAVEQGQLSLDDPVSAWGIEDGGLTPAEKAARVRDLLTGRSGVYLPAAAESQRMKKRRPARGRHPPGTFFYYNNWDFNALGEIYQRATQKSIFLAFERLIARPLCLQDFDPYRDGTLEYDSAAPRFPSYAFRLSARDLARLGLLYLGDGRWQGRQVLPAAWIAESTRPAVRAGRGGLHDGFGYMWWTTGASTRLPEALANSHTAFGAGGQQMTVLPTLESVVLVRTRTPPGPKGRSAYADAAEWTRFVKKLAATREDAGR